MKIIRTIEPERNYDPAGAIDKAPFILVVDREERFLWPLRPASKSILENDQAETGNTFACESAWHG